MVKHTQTIRRQFADKSLSVFDHFVIRVKKTLITDTTKTTTKLRHFFISLGLLQIKIFMISFFDSAVKS